MMLILTFIQLVLVCTITAYNKGSYVFGLIGGGAITLIAVAGYPFLKGTVWYRSLIAIAFAVFFTIIVQQNEGVGEAHFHYFISVAILSRYKDLVPLLVHTVLITIHHTLLTYCQSIGLEFPGLGEKIAVFNWGDWLPYAVHMFSAIVTVLVASYIIHGNITQFFATQQNLLSIKGSHQTLAENRDTFKKTVTTIKNSGNAMQGLLDEHNSHVATQAHALSKISSSMEELAASSEHSSHSIKDQFKELDQIHNFSSELNNTFQQVSSSTASLSQSVEQVQSRSDNVSDLFNRVKSSLEEIHNSFTRVSEITSMIAEIADRTNLLALNASIEAARAGDHGRGFAVVADEVSKLADTSTKNARDISEIIENSGRIIESGRGVTEEAVSEFRSQVEDFGALLISQQSLNNQMEKQRELTATFIKSITRLRELGQTVNQVASEQKNGTDHVASSIVSLEEAMQSLASCSRDLGPQIQKIQGLATMLDNTIQRN